MKKIVITFGLIAGAIVSAVMMIGMVMGGSTSHSMAFGYAIMVLAFSMIFVAIKSYRDKHNNGSVTFGKAFLIGLYIALIASTMYVIAWAITYNYFIPDFMEKYMEPAITAIQNSAKDQAVKDAQIAELNKSIESYKNPVFFTLITYTEILPVGLIISLISSLILKKKQPETETA